MLIKYQAKNHKLIQQTLIFKSASMCKLRGQLRTVYVHTVWLDLLHYSNRVLIYCNISGATDNNLRIIIAI